MELKASTKSSLSHWQMEILLDTRYLELLLLNGVRIFFTLGRIDIFSTRR